MIKGGDIQFHYGYNVGCFHTTCLDLDNIPYSVNRHMNMQLGQRRERMELSNERVRLPTALADRWACSKLSV